MVETRLNKLASTKIFTPLRLIKRAVPNLGTTENELVAFCHQLKLKNFEMYDKIVQLKFPERTTRRILIVAHNLIGKEGKQER